MATWRWFVVVVLVMSGEHHIVLMYGKGVCQGVGFICL